jgi:hypothetical protein
LSRKPENDRLPGAPKKAPAERRKLSLEPLEPRILLSADPLQLALADSAQTDDNVLHTATESATLDHDRTADVMSHGLGSGDPEGGAEGEWIDDVTDLGDGAQAWSEWAVEDDLETSDRAAADVAVTSVQPADEVAPAAETVALETRTATAVSPSEEATENDSETDPTESSSTSELAADALP